MKNLTIIIASGFPLSKNPRVVKEADALAAAGHQVTVVSAIFEQSAELDLSIAQARQWHCVWLINAASTNLTTRLRWLYLRIRRKWFNALYEITGYSDPRQLSYCTSELLSYCQDHKADHYCLHLESSLALAPMLCRLNRSYSVDFEDWYSRDITEAQRAERPSQLIEQLEAQASKNAAFLTAASDSMAQAIGNAYDVSPPTTVYNCFPYQPLSQTHSAKSSAKTNQSQPLKICWFSQTIGESRGLEDLLNVTTELKDVEVHLIGKVSDHYQRTLLKVDGALQFHAYVAPDDLVTYLTQFDVGYAGEPSNIISSDLTVANKVFQYLLAGLPIIASNTTGQKEIANQVPNAIRLFSDRTSLLACIQHWQAREKLQLGRNAAKLAAKQRYNWESESKTMVETINKTHSIDA